MLRVAAAATLAVALSTAALAQSVKYGDDTGDYPGDGECDDRRFYGTAMATTLTWSAVGRDATDCRALHAAGRVELWDMEAARAATNCGMVKWGDDSSEYANDGTCDDPRFEGMGAADLIYSEDSGRDASDCRRLCEYGLIFLRDY